MRICIFVYFLISLNPVLLKNIAHVWSFKHFLFVYFFICVFVYFRFYSRKRVLKNIPHFGSLKHFVFVYLRNCVFVYFAFDKQESHIWYPWIHAFQKYGTCWVYQALCIFEYLCFLCICIFQIWYTGMSYLISLNPMLLKNIAQ